MNKFIWVCTFVLGSTSLLLSLPPLSSLEFSGENSTLKTFSHAEIQKYVDQQWMSNRSLCDNLDALKLQPRLNLYSKINSNEVENYENNDRLISQRIDFNEKLQRYLGSIPDSQRALQDLILQNLQLHIVHSLNTSLWHRKQHHFSAAIAEIEKAMDVIKTYQSHLKEPSSPGFKTIDEYFTLTFYHKGKLHRMLAGIDLDRLDAGQLLECEKCYLAALKLNPLDPNINSSLGYLYLDMGKIDEALQQLTFADHLRPNCPDFIHGIAYAYYKKEKSKADKNEALCQENLAKAEDAFERALQLFHQFQTINSRVYHDRGLYWLLLGQKDKALDDFNAGLNIEPLHPLLLMERGLLLANFGRTEEALNDLKQGRIANQRNDQMQDKYNRAIEKVKSSVTISQQPPAKNHLDSIRDITKRAEFEKVLKECSKYVKGAKKPTCFISYAWNNKEHEDWVELFAEDLEKAGFQVLFDKWFTRKGYDTMDFVEKILAEETDFIIVVGTKQYLEKYRYTAKTKDQQERVVKIEARLLNLLIGYNQLHSNRVIPILLEGTPESSLPLDAHKKHHRFH